MHQTRNMAVIPEINLGGKTMAAIGMGTQGDKPIDDETAKAVFVEAIRTGYRHFDTAFLYGSELPLGQAIVEALQLGLIKSRDELFITSKLSPIHTHRDLVVPAIKISLRNLQLDYIDMYLIHMPLRVSDKAGGLPIPKECFLEFDIKSVWEGMEECVNLGLTKAIGVSNFSCRRTEELLSFAKIPPALNQVEMNPLWQQKKLREFSKAKGVHITAYSPLGANGTMWGDNRILECGILEEIAKARGKTAAQVSLRWVYEQGVSIVAKSFNKGRMKENLEIFDWSLTEEESNMISNLPQKKGVVFANMFGPHESVLELDAEF